jgi:hypothetical protein
MLSCHNNPHATVPNQSYRLGHADHLRAPRVVLRTESDQPYATQFRWSEFARDGAPWDEDEETWLFRAYEAGCSLEWLSAQLSRTRSAVKSRIKQCRSSMAVAAPGRGPRSTQHGPPTRRSPNPRRATTLTLGPCSRQNLNWRQLL